MRVLFLSGYTHPSHHLKVDLLADQPNVDILHLVWPGSGRADGWHLSANGQRRYQIKAVPIKWLSQPHNPHRVIQRSLTLKMTSFHPDIIHCEQEQEGLMALQVSLIRQLFCPTTPLILYSWQNIIRPRNWAVRWVSQLTRQAATHILCASTEAVEVLRRQGYRGGATVTPMLGLDRRYFSATPQLPMRQRLNLSGHTVGFVGRLVPEKGVDVLIRAIAKCGPDYSLLLVGSGPEQTSLQKLAQAQGISERCCFVEAVPYEGVRDYLCALDVLVLPSRTTPQWKEQYGRVLVEAMACRVAVVGSNSGAIPEVIDEAGWVFPEDDVEALVQALQVATASPQSRRPFIEQGEQRVNAYYTVERLATTIAQLWTTLIPKTLSHDDRL